MKKYLHIIFIAIALLHMASCAKVDIFSDIEFEAKPSDLNVQLLEDGRLGVTFDLPVKSFYNTEVAATRATAASGTETVIADGWALLFSAADEA
ncbi:MAG: hypothetical protein SNF93_06355, partial [Rikenellaceae bacterium]